MARIFYRTNITCVLFPVTFLNDQLHAVGLFVEVSVNDTVKGVYPGGRRNRVNVATGAERGALTET